MTSCAAEPPAVIRNDECTWPQLQQLFASGGFWGVVISPGPGTPAAARDIGEPCCLPSRLHGPETDLPSSPSYFAGVCLPLLQAGLAVPILGVCLGMQAIALAHGGQVQLAPEPVHGRVSEVQHSGHPLFAGIPSGKLSRPSGAIAEGLLPCLQEGIMLSGHCLTSQGWPISVQVWSKATLL